MLSMHSTLRDRLRRKALILDLIGLVGAILIVVGTVADPTLAGALSISSATLDVVVAALGMAIFAASLIALRVDWVEAAHRHAEAARILSELKSQGRLIAAGGASREECSHFLKIADARLSALTPIPDSAFVALKAVHLQKVRLSRLLDQRPGTILWVARLRLRISDSLAVAHGRDSGLPPGSSDESKG